MVIGETINITTEMLTGIITTVGQLVLFLQALGLIIVLWLIFQIVTLIVNRKKRKILENVQKDIKKLDKKIDKLLNNKKK